VLALSLFTHSPKSFILRTLLPLPSKRSLQALLNTVHQLGQASMFMCFMHSNTAENV
jgi:hypothetical protein